MFFTREYYIGHPDDDSDKFEETMNEILNKDDVNKLHEYLKVFGDCYHYPAFLDMCLERRSRNCALHIIQGKLPHGPPILAADHCGPQPKRPVLYNVIYVMCEPQVFSLLLTDCQVGSQANQPYLDLLPLHWLLDLLVKRPPLSNWSPAQPLSELIDLLFHPQVRPKLECARLLAQHTLSLDQIALGYILNEEIIPLAALLLVAPFTSVHFESIKPNASIKSIASQAVHGQYVTTATYCAAALLHIFEKDGDKLTSRFDNLQKGSAEGDQSFVNGLIPQPRKRLAQVSKGGQSFADHSIEQIGNFINYVRRLFSKSPQMIERASVNNMMCREDVDKIRELFGPDANLSSDQYLFLHFLLEGEENDTFQFLQENLSSVNGKVLHSRGGFPALISAIRNFCNYKNNAMWHFKSRDAYHVNPTYMRLLHFVLSSLVKYEYLSKWSPGQSLVKLILLIFLQHELRPTLECVQLIGERMNSVNEVAWKLIQQGDLVQLAGLLLVARKEAMEPFDSGDTIKEATSMENVSRVFRGGSTTKTTGAAGLLEIFEVAGDALAKYWSIHNDLCQEHEPAGVIVEVATIIQRSGIHVLSTDVDLTDIYSSSHPEMLKSICERLGLSQISKEPMFPSVKSVKERCRSKAPLFMFPMVDTTESLATSFRVPRSQASENLGTQGFSTTACIVERVRGGTLKQSWVWPSPSPLVRDLGYLAMKLKRRVRLV